MHSYTVAEVTPSKVVPNEALVWIGDAVRPQTKTIVWDIRKRGAFPTVGCTVTE